MINLYLQDNFITMFYIKDPIEDRADGRVFSNGRHLPDFGES